MLVVLGTDKGAEPGTVSYQLPVALSAQANWIALTRTLVKVWSLQ